MSLFVSLEYKDEKAVKPLLSQLSEPQYARGVIQRRDKKLIIIPPLFDVIQSRVESVKIKVGLILRHNGKTIQVVKPTFPKTDDYSRMLRILRMGEPILLPSDD